MDSDRWDNRRPVFRIGNSKDDGLPGTLMCRRCRDKVPFVQQRPCLFRKGAECTAPNQNLIVFFLVFRNCLLDTPFNLHIPCMWMSQP